MKQIAGGFRGRYRCIVVTVVVGLAVVAALSAGDDSRAQVTTPSLSTPQLSTPPLTVPSLTIPPVQVQVPPVSVPGTTIQTPPVTVQTPPVTTPKVQVPAVSVPPVTVPPVKAPSVTPPAVTAPSSQAPAVNGPAAPRLPALPNPRTPPAGGDGGAGPLPSLPLGGRSGAAGPGATGVGAAAGAGPAGATLAGLGLPDAAALRDASPARRRQLLRQAWDAPLRDAKLRRLRQTLREYGGCLDDLSGQGRRALMLRAGFHGGKPAPRRVIARRLGVSLKRELRVESQAMRRLTSAGERGLCGGGAALAAAGAVRAQELGAGAGGSNGGRWNGPEADEHGGVLGVAERGGDSTDGGGPSLGFIDTPGGAPSALLLLALAILGPLAVALLAMRSSGESKSPRA